MTQVHDRPLPEKSLTLAAVIALLAASALLGGWEYYWRDFGALVPYYRNSEGLWAIERRRIDKGEGHKTVLVGSSRMLFDMQLDVWERESGERPIQLSLEGTSPLRVMEGLAADADFTGRLLVGVSPDLFFSGFEYRETVIDRYGQESPAQWMGQQISMLLEPHLAFYDYYFALTTILKRQNLPKRMDVPFILGVPMSADVRQLGYHSRDRNTRLWSKIEDDPEYAALMKAGWADGFEPIDARPAEWLAGFRQGRMAQIDRAVAVVGKLRERGIEVIFVRHPAVEYFALEEPMYHPREETWDVLIESTGALGIHWQDHEELQGYWLPESSHLSGAEADRFTKALYGVIERERALRNAGERE
jgi:hypothetical protein